jgi:hypothetical protein
MTATAEVAILNRSLPEKLEYARYLAASGLLPAQYRDKPANVLWAAEFGDMIGIPTMASILGVHVIEGKPSASAALISALVRRAGHRIRTWGDDEKAVTEIVRSDDPDFTYRVEWTISRAKQADLAGKGTWKKYPAALLKARTVTECARDACQEVLFGLQYTPEELGAEVDGEGEPIQATAVVDPGWTSKPATAAERGVDSRAAGSGRDWMAEIDEAVEVGDPELLRVLWRATTKADVAVRERIAGELKALVEAQPPAPAADPADEPVDAELVDEPVSKVHNAHMHVMWGKSGVTREERLAITSHLLGREVETSKDLTDADAVVLIERLRAFDAVGGDALREAADRWLAEWAEAQGAAQ